MTPDLLRSQVWLYPRIIVTKSHENTSKYVDTETLFFSKKKMKGHWPLDDLWSQVCWDHICDSTQGSLCPSPMKIHQSMWIQWPFFKNLNQRSLTPRWPLTLHLLRSHVWLYPRIIVSKSHGNTSMYVIVDTVINFAKYHIHTHTTYYIHIYYVLHTEWVIIIVSFWTQFRRDDHIVSFWTQFRWDKKEKTNKQTKRQKLNNNKKKQSFLLFSIWIITTTWVLKKIQENVVYKIVSGTILIPTSCVVW